MVELRGPGVATCPLKFASDAPSTSGSRLGARRLNQLSEDACLVAPLGAARSGQADPEVETQPELPRVRRTTHGG